MGKSTLLNTLLGQKISIISGVPQTTRHQIRGILNVANAQIVFVDTPGIHSFKKKLASRLNVIAKKSVSGIDLVLYIVDVSRSIGKEEYVLMRFVAQSKVPVIMVLNKIDLGVGFLNEYIERWEAFLQERNIDKNPVKYYIPVSAKTGKNTQSVSDAIVQLLPLHPPFYGPEEVTDFPLNYRVADIVREKLFLNLKEELPHSVAVEIKQIDEKDTRVVVYASIYVNRASQKKIIIGKGGAMIKDIGIAARGELQELFKRKVYLDLRVKVVRDWQNKPRILQELGYWQ